MEIQLKKIEISYVLEDKLTTSWCLVPISKAGINPMASVISNLELIAEGSEEHDFIEMQVKTKESLVNPQQFKCNNCGEVEESYDELAGIAHKCTPDGDRLHDGSFGTFEEVGHLGYTASDGEDFENQEVDRMSDED